MSYVQFNRISRIKAGRGGQGPKTSCSHDRRCPLNITLDDDVANLAKTLAPCAAALASQLAQQPALRRQAGRRTDEFAHVLDKTHLRPGYYLC